MLAGEVNLPEGEALDELPEHEDPGLEIGGEGEWVIQEIPRIHGSSLCEGSCVRGAPTLHVMHSFILCVVAFISDVSREHDTDSFVDLCALRV